MAVEEVEYDGIPRWQIREGWLVDDIEALDECSEALDILDDDIATIESQLASFNEGLYRVGEKAWALRARNAFKKKCIVRTRLREKKHLLIQEAQRTQGDARREAKLRAHHERQQTDAYLYLLAAKAGGETHVSIEAMMAHIVHCNAINKLAAVNS